MTDAKDDAACNHPFSHRYQPDEKQAGTACGACGTTTESLMPTELFSTRCIEEQHGQCDGLAYPIRIRHATRCRCTCHDALPARSVPERPW